MWTEYMNWEIFISIWIKLPGCHMRIMRDLDAHLMIYMHMSQTSFSLDSLKC